MFRKTSKDQDIRFLNKLAYKILGIKKSKINGINLLFMTTNSNLTVEKINYLAEHINMNDPFTINVAMGLANKGATNNYIIHTAKKL